MKRKLLLIGLMVWTAGAHAAVTNVYHTNRVFKPIAFNINGTPSAYEVYTMAGKLTNVVGPTNIIVNASNTFARESEAVAWGYPSAQDAWLAVSAAFITHTQTHPTSTFNNVGWTKGTCQAYGDWGAYLWLMQNQVDFRTSETNIWVSPAGKTNFIVKVMVGSIGDYPPMTNIVDIGPTNWAMITNYAGEGSTEEQFYKGDYTAYYELLLLSMTAYRPATENPYYGRPFRKREVPDSQEEIPGVGIRINGDDDNGNTTPDCSDTTVSNENDLIEVTLRATPNPLGLKYILKRNNTNIKVWCTRNKGTALLDANNETNLTFNMPWMTVWVENPNGGISDLELEARTVPGDILVTSDVLHFYSFQSIVIGLSGEVWPGGDYLDNGMFDAANALYRRGYDVHYYDEDEVNANGAGAAYDEAVSAIQHRGVTHVGIYGHSHGGGSTHDLAGLLNANRGTIGTFTIDFTAYVDAIENSSDINMDSEANLPPGTLYHMNYFETNDLLLVGAVVPGANENLNVNTTGWGQNLDHGAIDNDDHVVNAIRDNVLQQMQQP